MVNTERVQRPVKPTQGKPSGTQGKPGLMQRLRALPARDWLLIAIGAGTLVVAWLAYRRNSSSNTLPNLLTDPTAPVIGGGGGATDNTTGQTAAGQVAVTGPQTGIVLDNQQQQQQHQGGPIDWGSQVVPSGNYPGTDSGSDPTYGANIKVVPTAQTASYQHYTDASSDPTYGKVTTPAASVSATATQQSRNNVGPVQPHQAPAVTPSMPILGVLIKRGRQ